MIQHHRVRHLAKHKNKQKEPFDYIVYFVTVATPLFELPQAYAIYSTKSAESVSLYTWGFFFLNSVVLLTYSVKNRLRPLIIMYSMYLLVEASIVTGIILYR